MLEQKFIYQHFTYLKLVIHIVRLLCLLIHVLALLQVLAAAGKFVTGKISLKMSCKCPVNDLQVLLHLSCKFFLPKMAGNYPAFVPHLSCKHVCRIFAGLLNFFICGIFAVYLLK